MFVMVFCVDLDFAFEFITVFSGVYIWDSYLFIKTHA